MLKFLIFIWIFLFIYRCRLHAVLNVFYIRYLYLQMGQRAGTFWSWMVFSMLFLTMPRLEPGLEPYQWCHYAGWIVVVRCKFHTLCGLSSGSLHTIPLDPWLAISGGIIWALLSVGLLLLLPPPHVKKTKVIYINTCDSVFWWGAAVFILWCCWSLIIWRSYFSGKEFGHHCFTLKLAPVQNYFWRCILTIPEWFTCHIWTFMFTFKRIYTFLFFVMHWPKVVHVCAIYIFLCIKLKFRS